MKEKRDLKDEENEFGVESSADKRKGIVGMTDDVAVVRMAREDED